jgi:hypothetical protein
MLFNLFHLEANQISKLLELTAAIAIKVFMG